MPKKIIPEIVESVDFLQREHSKAKGLLKKDRIKTLLYIKEGKYHFKATFQKSLVDPRKQYVVGCNNI